MTFLTPLTGLYSKLEQQELDRAQSGNSRPSFTKYPGQIIATHVQDSDVYLSFRVVISDSTEDMSRFDESSLGAVRPPLLILDDTALDSAAKLDRYVQAIGPYLHEQERSPFMKVTIGVASDLCVERNVSQLSHPKGSLKPITPIHPLVHNQSS